MEDPIYVKATCGVFEALGAFVVRYIRADGQWGSTLYEGTEEDCRAYADKREEDFIKNFRPPMGLS